MENTTTHKCSKTCRPLIHYAGYIRNAIIEKNRFATPDFIEELIKQLERAYLSCPSYKTGLRLMAAIDALDQAELEVKTNV